MCGVRSPPVRSVAFGNEKNSRETIGLSAREDVPDGRGRGEKLSKKPADLRVSSPTVSVLFFYFSARACRATQKDILTVVNFATGELFYRK